MKKNFIYLTLMGALLHVCGCGDDDSKIIGSFEEPASSSSSITDEDFSDVYKVSSSNEFVESSEAKQESSSSIESSFVWDGGHGDVPRDFFNGHMKNRSSDSSFLLAPEVLGIGYMSRKENGFHYLESTNLEKISLEDAKKIFPNTIKTLQKDGILLKEEYYLVFISVSSDADINILTKVGSDTLFSIATYQKWEDMSYEVPYGCFDVEELFDIGVIYLVDTDKDLSNAIITGIWKFDHSWNCDCEKTDESCLFLKTFYYQESFKSRRPYGMDF